MESIITKNCERKNYGLESTPLHCWELNNPDLIEAVPKRVVRFMKANRELTGRIIKETSILSEAKYKLTQFKDKREKALKKIQSIQLKLQQAQDAHNKYMHAEQEKAHKKRLVEE